MSLPGAKIVHPLQMQTRLLDTRLRAFSDYGRHDEGNDVSLNLMIWDVSALYQGLTASFSLPLKS